MAAKPLSESLATQAYYCRRLLARQATAALIPLPLVPPDADIWLVAERVCEGVDVEIVVVAHPCPVQ